MEWAHEPLLYTGASGSTLTEMRYETDRDIMKQSYENARKAISVEQLADHAQTWGNMIGDMFGGAFSDGRGAFPGLAVIGAAREGISHIGDAIALSGRDTMRDFQKARLDDTYNMGAAKELQELKLATTIRAPELHFPKSTSIRDYLGNGVYVLRYRPQGDATHGDIQKLDKILTMYGYKDTKVLESSDFTGRAKFNYVKANGVQIGGNLPKWLRDAVAAQLSAGVRIWHQLPDIAAYTDGSNV